MYTFVKGEPNWVDPLNANFQEIATIAGGAIPASEKGVTGGIATLDSDGKLAQMPTAEDVEAPDWERGTWTPTVTGYNGTHSATLNIAEGWFYRIGKIVKLAGTIKLSNKGQINGTDRLYIGGLPYMPAYYDTSSHTYFKGAVKIAGVLGELTKAQSIGLYTPTIGGGPTYTNLTANDITDDFELTEISATYIIE